MSELAKDALFVIQLTNEVKSGIKGMSRLFSKSHYCICKMFPCIVHGQGWSEIAPPGISSEYNTVKEVTLLDLFRELCIQVLSFRGCKNSPIIW